MVWISVETPAVQLRRIDRDAGTQGMVYCAWPVTKKFLCGLAEPTADAELAECAEQCALLPDLAIQGLS